MYLAAKGLFVISAEVGVQRTGFGACSTGFALPRE